MTAVTVDDLRGIQNGFNATLNRYEKNILTRYNKNLEPDSEEGYAARSMSAIIDIAGQMTYLPLHVNAYVDALLDIIKALRVANQASGNHGDMAFVEAIRIVETKRKKL